MSDKDPNNPVKEYTGVWIPKEVIECEDLSPTEKLAYGEIACFEVCYASNAWLAKRIGKNEWTANRCVAKLIELGFVENCGFNGRFREIRVVKNHQHSEKSPGRVVKNHQSACGKITNIDKSIEQSKENISTIVDIGDTANFGNEKINQMFLKWEEMFGYKQKDSKANRYACYNMLRAKDKGEDWLVNTMKLASESLKDRYAGKEVRGNAGFADIQKNYPKIWQWGKAKYEEMQTKGKEFILCK